MDGTCYQYGAHSYQNMNWHIKGIIQKILSFTSAGAMLTDALQRTLGKFRDFDGSVDRKVGDWSVSAVNLPKAGVCPVVALSESVLTGCSHFQPALSSLAQTSTTHPTSFGTCRHTSSIASLNHSPALGGIAIN